MPRYRFNWDSLPPRVVKELSASLALKGDNPADALRAAYGARPKSDFVRDAWPALRDKWLADDEPSRAHVIEQLRLAGLGAADGAIRTREDQINYLRSCHNQLGLRDIVLPQFLAIGEASSAVPPLQIPPSADIQSPSTHPADPGGSPAPAPATTAVPAAPWADAKTLSDFVGAVIKDLLKLQELRRDNDGDIPINTGHSLIFVRTVEVKDQIPYVHIFSPVLRDVPKSPELLETLNEINLGIMFAKFVHTPAQEIVLASDVPAMGISPQQVAWATSFMSHVADYYHTQISKRFGGAQWSEDTRPSVDV